MGVTFHPAAVLRRSAQSIRHAPGLRLCAPLWDSLRAPYRRMLTTLAGRNGMPVVIGGFRMRVAPDVVNLNWETVEVTSYQVFAEEVQPGDVVFDVGAHFGTYSMIGALRSGPGGHVIAYEPSALTRTYLARHLAWNGLADRVRVRDVCCGAAVGTTTFYAHPDLPEGINGVLPHEGLAATTVPCTTIDAEADALRLVPTVIKIDVEGFESDVIAGAAGVLTRHVPRLLVSLHPRRLAQQGIVPTDILNRLRSFGYSPRIVDEDQEVHVLAKKV